MERPFSISNLISPAFQRRSCGAAGWRKRKRARRNDCLFFSGSSRAALEPERPDGVHAGVGDGRGWHSPLLAPGPTVENPGDACQHNIAPVEVRRTFIQRGDTEENPIYRKPCPAPHAPVL